MKKLYQNSIVLILAFVLSSVGGVSREAFAFSECFNCVVGAGDTCLYQDPTSHAWVYAGESGNNCAKESLPNGPCACQGGLECNSQKICGPEVDVPAPPGECGNGVGADCCAAADNPSGVNEPWCEGQYEGGLVCTADDDDPEVYSCQVPAELHCGASGEPCCGGGGSEDDGCDGNVLVCFENRCCDPSKETCENVYLDPNYTPPPWTTRPMPDVNISLMISLIRRALIPVAILIGVVFIIINGYKLMTSQGDPRKLQDAREGLTSAIIGIVFVLLAAVILNIILEGLLGR